MVSTETGLPDSFDPKTGKNIKWSVPLGTQTWATPVVSQGKVFIGTNNERPRNPKHKGDRGVLLCLDEKDGSLAWQLVVAKRPGSPFLEWPRTGICSPATVEGDRVYIVTNRGEIACLDIHGLANGNDGPFRDEGKHIAPDGKPPEEVCPNDADILWVFDPTAQVGVHQHDGAHCSILIHGQYLYACTSNGVDDSHQYVVSPKAPSLIVLDKNTGRLVATDAENIGPRIIHCTWSSPSLGEVKGKPLVFFGGGDACIYAFNPFAGAFKEAKGSGPGPSSLARVWRFVCDPAAPTENVHKWQENRREGPSHISGMPVFDQGRVYVTVGGDIWHGKRQAWLKCIDAGQPEEKNTNRELWNYPMKGHCVCTPAIHQGLAYVTDCSGTIHCVDTATGKACWTHATRSEIWASPLVADGKVFVGTRRGEFMIFAEGREEKLLNTIDLEEPLNGSPVAANGTLYVPAMSRLYAVHKGEK